MPRIPVVLSTALAAAIIAVGAPPALAHDDVSTVAGHAAEDAVLHTPGQEKLLDKLTVGASKPAAQAAAAALAGGPQDIGSWGPVVDWPVVGVHVALLPNGKVLAYDSVGDNAT